MKKSIYQLKVIIFIFLFITTSFEGFAEEKSSLHNKPAVSSVSPVQFLNREIDEHKNNFRHNRYEDIIAGTVALIIGTIGHLTTSNKILSLSYSGIQSIGIVNIGKGYYENSSPHLGEEIRSITNSISEKKLDRPMDDYISSHFIHYYAKEDAAKRKTIFTISSLLSLQFSTNALFNNPHKDLKKIYLYLATINVMIATFSYFYRSNFEKYLLEQNSKEEITLAPIAFMGPKEKRLGMAFQINF